MPAPKMPPQMPSSTGAAAAEALDGILAGRTGWTTNDRGWEHKTGLHIEARAGTSPFRCTGGSAGTERLIATRSGLLAFLELAGA